MAAAQKIRTVDGAQGEGGGQVLRTTLAIALMTGEPVRLERIRAGRERPGLMRQHLAAIRAAAAISGAAVEGDAPGSTELTFRPGPIAPGEYAIAVGTAGSTTLVLQTILPALLRARGPSTVTLEGGTHNPLAPTFDFLDRAFLPLLRRMGADVTATLERPGFFPAGGGRIRAEVRPQGPLRPLSILERGEIRARRATALVAGLPHQIARRECAALHERLGWPEESFACRTLEEEHGPGNVVTVELESEHVTEVAVAFGARGLPAEKVAALAADEVKRYLASGAPVGEHLADQLVLPLALAGGGAFRTLPPSRHTRTQVALVRDLLGARIRCEPAGERAFEIAVEGR